MPEGWTAASNVEWTYSNVSFPVRMSARIAASDGSAWMEWFPAEMFYWLEPRDTSVAVGGHALGMIHRPGIGVQEAVHRFVLARYRGRAQNLQILGSTGTSRRATRASRQLEGSPARSAPTTTR